MVQSSCCWQEREREAEGYRGKKRGYWTEKESDELPGDGRVGESTIEVGTSLN